MNEICGDGQMSITDRFAYLIVNLARNLRGMFAPGDLRHWHPETPVPAGTTASPGRLLTEAFIARALPRLYPVAHVRVLDIGCGGGRMAHWLAAAGYCGDYVGIDIDDRYRPPTGATATAFRCRFVRGDVHDVAFDDTFDLIVSISALEHIADDHSLVSRLDHLLAPGGVQIHIVPGPCGLFAYLWHGYRQYGRHAITTRFGLRGTVVYRLGGAASLLLHIVWITLPETLLRLTPRQRAPGLYRRMVAAGLRLDRYLPFGAIMYAICTRPAPLAVEPGTTCPALR